jgi:hypothetical protein
MSLASETASGKSRELRNHLLKRPSLRLRVVSEPTLPVLDRERVMAPDSLSVIRFDRLLKDSAVVQAWVPGTESEIVVLRISSAKRPASAQDVAGSSKLPPDRCNAS